MVILAVKNIAKGLIQLHKMNKLIKKAFTLIELLVVIAIIGILSGLIVVSLGGMTTKASIAKAQVFSNSIKNSLMLNLVSEWKLDGNAVDSWGTCSNGTIYGSPVTETDCVYGSCYSFDRTDDYIQINSNPLASVIVKDFAVTAWFKRKGLSGGTSASDWHGIVRGISGDGWYPRVLVNSGGSLIYLQYESSSGVHYEVSSTGSLNFDLNKWHFLTVTKGPFGVKMYFDGKLVLENSSLNHDLMTASGGSLLIGCGASPLIHYMTNGSIDDVRIFKEAINLSQIKEYYYLGLNSLLGNKNITKEEYLSRINEYAIK